MRTPIPTQTTTQTTTRTTTRTATRRPPSVARPTGPRRAVRHAAIASLCAAAWGSAAACSAADLVGDPGTNGGADATPDAVKSPQGALLLYNGVVTLEARAVGSVVFNGGFLTDELRTATFGDLIDARRIPEGSGVGSTAYGTLQSVRANARQGRGVLSAYAPAAPATLRGHLYAIEGMADVMLADLFCSGIPLSTVDYDGDFTLAAGSSTKQVYQAAVALFDSALALTGDSTRLTHYAAVGKGRALLELGEYELAAAAVAAVPDDYTYGAYVVSADGSTSYEGFLRPGTLNPSTSVVSDREGGNGHAFVSAGDPRSTVDTMDMSVWTDPGTPPLHPLYLPRKYASDGSTPFVVASGVEARLIQAEADLRTGGAQWLSLLNALRTTGTYGGVDTTVTIDTTYPGGVQTVDTTTRVDTLWDAGTGGVAGLGPLRDPGTQAARLDLLFDERAEWLWLTGHRLGDLRRRLRIDRRPQSALFPTGPYVDGVYGTDVNFAVPPEERDNNAKYAGCMSRDT